MSAIGLRPDAAVTDIHPLAGRAVVHLIMGCGSEINDLPGAEEVEFWGDMLIQITDLASTRVGSDVIQTILAHLRAPGVEVQ